LRYKVEAADDSVQRLRLECVARFDVVSNVAAQVVHVPVSCRMTSRAMTIKYYELKNSTGQPHVEPVTGPAELMKSLRRRTTEAGGMPTQCSLVSDVATAWNLWDAQEDVEGDD
jgi:hypothetical protein